MVRASSSTDIPDRPGVAVELTDRHLGPIQLIFDPNTHAYLGERDLNEPGSADSASSASSSGSSGSSGFQISYAVCQVAIVDKSGQLPAS